MHDQQATGTIPDDSQRIYFTGIDDAVNRVIHPLIDLIITLRTVDCEQPQDAYLEALIYIDNVAHLRCRHIDQHCNPIGDTWTVPVSQLAHIHIW